MYLDKCSANRTKGHINGIMMLMASVLPLSCLRCKLEYKFRRQIDQNIAAKGVITRARERERESGSEMINRMMRMRVDDGGIG